MNYHGSRGRIYADGSFTLNVFRASIILISLEGEKYEYSLMFTFTTTNNKT